eukprot:162950-Prymnesium_polylepis.1
MLTRQATSRRPRPAPQSSHSHSSSPDGATLTHTLWNHRAHGPSHASHSTSELAGASDSRTSGPPVGRIVLTRRLPKRHPCCACRRSAATAEQRAALAHARCLGATRVRAARR